MRDALEKQGVRLCDALDELERAERSVNVVNGDIGAGVREKFQTVVSKNSGLAVLKAVKKVSSASAEIMTDLWSFSVCINYVLRRGACIFTLQERASC